MRVLGNEERLEPARLRLAGQLVDANRVVRGEHADADVHGNLPGLVECAVVEGSLAAKRRKVQCSPDPLLLLLIRLAAAVRGAKPTLHIGGAYHAMSNGPGRWGRGGSPPCSGLFGVPVPFPPPPPSGAAAGGRGPAGDARLPP